MALSDNLDTLIHNEQWDDALEHLKTFSWKNYKDCAWLRKKVIAPAMVSQHFSFASQLLKLIVLNHPHSLTDLMTLSSVLIRQNKRIEACCYLERILALDPENYSVAAQWIQLKYQEGQLEAAANLAMSYEHAFLSHDRLLKIALMVLPKANQAKKCLNAIALLNFADYPLEIGLLAAQVAFDANDQRLAQTIVSQLQAQGHQDARLYLLLAKIKGVESPEAMQLLLKAQELDPEHIQVQGLLGELLLKTGQPKRALEYLEKYKQQGPQNSHARLLNARALKETGQYEQAASEMLALLKLQPDSFKWQRYAASALAQAGKIEEAKAIFAQGVRVRNAHLPKQFAEGLDTLEEKIDNLSIPVARFNWLWQMVDPHQKLSELQRGEIEQEAKWIHLLDHLLIDWLECKPHQADEIMVYFDDLSSLDALLRHHLSQEKGLVLAGAHLGPLFAIPLALDLLDFPHKWLASSPNRSSLSYKDTLISTSEQTETEVVRQALQSLRAKEILALAVDGAMSPSAPRCVFENQKVTYSDFAAKMVFRTQAPSFFISSYWKEGTIYFQLNPLPQPKREETLDAFCVRWRTHFFSLLKDYLILHPTNARLSGGLWRHVR